MGFDLKREYFNHLVDIVCDKNHLKTNYIPLLDLLHSIPFKYSIDMDENRAGDGAHLRKDWLQSINLYDYLQDFSTDKVSVLEVLIGIAKRYEFQVGDIMLGDHTNERFWELLSNLDIEKYTAKRYNPLEIKEKVRVWMLRKFSKDGSGSIFPVKNGDKMGDISMTDLQIWDQMNIYIEENWG